LYVRKELLELQVVVRCSEELQALVVGCFEGIQYAGVVQQQ